MKEVAIISSTDDLEGQGDEEIGIGPIVFVAGLSPENHLCVHIRIRLVADPTEAANRTEGLHNRLLTFPKIVDQFPKLLLQMSHPVAFSFTLGKLRQPPIDSINSMHRILAKHMIAIAMHHWLPSLWINSFLIGNVEIRLL